MTILLKSNAIFDVDQQNTFNGAITIVDKKINHVYHDLTTVDLNQFDKIYDFGDQMIIPGFIDAHQHTYIIALVQAGVLTPIDYGSLQTVLAQLQTTPVFGGWKIPLGFYASELGIDSFPTATEIDAYEADIPVMLVAGDVHSVWLNSKALTLIKITQADIDLAGGDVMYDQNGAMTGFFTEGIAIHIFTQVLSNIVSDPATNYLTYFNELNQQGVTGIGVLALSGRASEDLVTENVFAEIQDTMTVRAALFPAMREDEARLQTLITNFKNTERVKIAGTKQFYDGVTSTQTAYMLDDYPNTVGEKGTPMLSDETLHALIKRSNALDLPIRVHAIGDRAVRETLTAFEEAKKDFPMSAGKHNVIEHLEVFNPIDLSQLATTDAILSVQPSHALIGYEGLWQEVGHWRLPWMFAFKDFLNHGATLAFGTDAPVVINQTPLQTIFQAVTRRTLANQPGVGAGFDQVIPVGEALKAHTLNAALANQQHLVGRIKADYFADLAILSENLLTINPEDILKVEVTATMFDGKFVWQK